MIELAFLHIPKTAGRTLAGHIGAQYPDDAIVNVSRDALARQRRSLRNLVDKSTRVLMGHLHFRDVEEFLGPETKIITFLREPVDRVLSHYEYKVAIEFPRQKKEIPLRVAWRGWMATRERSRSSVHALATLARDPGRLRRPPSLDDWIHLRGTRNVASRYLEGCSLSRLWFVGFQERFASDLHRLASTLEWKTVNEGLAINVNPQRRLLSGVSPELRRRIVELNQEDVRLFRRAADVWDYPL